MSSRQSEPTAGPAGDRIALHPRAWVAPGAILVGDVSLGAASSVWYGCVLRGDLEPITVGRETNIQDACVVHVDQGYPARIGERVTVGHRAVVHGCEIDDEALIGMGAVLLTGCRIGAGAVVAAGALVREGFEVPESVMVGGVPARILGEVDDALRRRIREGVRGYVEGAALYRDGRLGGGPFGGTGREPRVDPRGNRS